MQRWVSLAAWAVLLPGCNRSSETAPAPPSTSAVAQAAASAPLPVDRTLPGELREGNARVAGLLLPDGFSVDRVFETETYAHGPASPEQTANYLRRRLEASSVEVGAIKTVFFKARPRGGSNLLRVEVIARGLATELIIVEVPTQVPTPDPSLSDEERWRKAGLKPNGELLDPQKAF